MLSVTESGDRLTVTCSCGCYSLTAHKPAEPYDGLIRCLICGARGIGGAAGQLEDTARSASRHELITKSPLVAVQTEPNIAIQRENSYSEWICALPMRDDWLEGEPPIHEILTDPIVHLVMRRDNIGLSDVWAAVDRARSALHGPAERSRDVA